MHTFKIAPKYYGPKPHGKFAKRRLKAALAEGVLKARLRRSGLWDESAARSGHSLTVTRIIHAPSIA